MPEALPDKLDWVYRQIAARLGPGLEPSLDRACMAMAAYIDDRPGLYDRNPYHNRQHYCEVALTAYFICLAEQAGQHETQRILLAALVHDFVHDGGSRTPFELERASVRGAIPILRAAGVRAAEIDKITALVLCTDPSVGTRYMSDTLRAHRRGGVVPDAPAEAPELGMLVDDAALTRLGRVLCEADLVPSIGLTFAHSMRLQQRLSREWCRPLLATDKLAFIEGVLAHGFLGTLFLPNVEAARLTLIDMVHANAPV